MRHIHRLAVSLGVAVVSEALWNYLIFRTPVLGRSYFAVVDALLRPWMSPEWKTAVGHVIFASLPPLILMFVVYYACGKYVQEAEALPEETLCRGCGYILRGLSEPRCPECGERI
jgi:hypothetical protein